MLYFGGAVRSIRPRRVGYRGRPHNKSADQLCPPGIYHPATRAQSSRSRRAGAHRLLPPSPRFLPIGAVCGTHREKILSLEEAGEAPDEEEYTVPKSMSCYSAATGGRKLFLGGSREITY